MAQRPWKQPQRVPPRPRLPREGQKRQNMGAAWGRTPALVASLGRTIPRQWRRDGSHPHLTSLPGLASRSAGRRLAEREVAHFPPQIFSPCDASARRTHARLVRLLCPPARQAHSTVCDVRRARRGGMARRARASARGPRAATNQLPRKKTKLVGRRALASPCPRRVRDRPGVPWQQDGVHAS